jgi:hypothetical protein
MPKRFLVALLCLLLLFFPLLWISQYIYPSGDDYFIAFQAKKLGALGATKWWYFNWSGRYSFLFLQSLISSFNSWVTLYKAFPVALFLAGFGCLYYFVRAFFGRGFSKTTSFILSAVLYAFLISLTPDVATGFYWLTASIQYSGALFTSLLIFSLYINFTVAKKSLTRTAYALLIAFLIAFLAGLNEASALWLVATFGFINGLHIVEFKRPRKWALAFLTIGIAFCLVSFLSPGTRARIGQIGAEGHLLTTIGGAIGLTFYLFTELLTSTPLLPASIIYLTFLSANRDRLERLSALMRGVRWHWLLLFMLLSLTAVNFIIFTAVGVNSLPDRLKNVYVYSIFFGWLLLMTALFFDLSRKKLSLAVPSWITGVLAVTIIGFLLTGYKLELSRRQIIPSSSQSQKFFSLISTQSVYANAYLDILSGRAERFAQQNAEREERVRNAQGDAVEFPLYSYVPETIFVQDVNQPAGAPDWLTIIFSGEIKHLNYMETGPPPPVKKKL